MSEGKKDCKKVQGFFVDQKNVQKNNDKKFDLHQNFKFFDKNIKIIHILTSRLKKLTILTIWEVYSVNQ